MNASRPVVVHPGEVIATSTTPAMDVRQYADPEGRWCGWSGWIRNEAGDVGGWHHHAANETFVYVIRGSIRIEFGPGGAEHLDARAGDFFVVPSHVIHRETTGGDSDLDAFVLRIGTVPEYVEAAGPEASSD